jgi:thermitase
MAGALALAVAAAACLALTGCGGQTAATAPAAVTQGLSTAEAGRGTGGTDNGQTSAVQLLESTGTAGVDYTREVIEVLYRAQATSTALAQNLIAEGRPAATRPNAILRRNRDYEPLTAAIADRYGLVIRQEVYINGFNWAALNIPAGRNGEQIMQAIGRDFAPVVASAGFSGIGRAGYLPDDPDFLSSNVANGPQWGHRRIGCRDAWDYTLGDNSLLIGVVDTGVYIGHEELAGQVLDPQVAFPGYHLDIINNDNTVEDGAGHGTAVTGIIAAATDNGRTVAGVASDCRIIPVKIANTGDFALYADMIAGIQLAALLGARVVNLSWYGAGATNPFRLALAELQAQGVLVVVCAGNSGLDQSAYPAAYDECLSVGATDQNDNRASFSNWGEDVDLAAPGLDLKVLTNAGGYTEWWGTSFSSPMVAGGAALLWSAAPNLSLANVRSILESAGPPAVGFMVESDVHRLALGEALASIPEIEVPAISELIMQDSVELTPVVSGDVQSVELYVNGEFQAVVSEAPWTVSVDLSGYGFEVLELEFRALGQYATVSAYTAVLVDNSDSVFEMAVDFEAAPYQAVDYDARYLAPALLTELKQANPESWTREDITAVNNGPAFWRSTNDGQSGKAMRYANYGDNYGSWETDFMVTRRINLTHAKSAQLEFYTKHNIDSSGGDRGWALITADEGATFERLETAEQTAYYTGYQPEYYQQLIDLTDWLGQEVRIIFLFESDAEGAGDQTGEIAAWWLDEIRVTGEWVALGGVQTTAAGVLGAVSGVVELTAEPLEPIYAQSVEYWLDFAPFDQMDPYDLTGTATAAPFSQEFNLSGVLQRPNQLALLKATPLGTDEYPGATLTSGIYLFNYLGDVNADGVVDAADSAAYAEVVGLSSGEAGYIPLFDSDLDGVITEADAGVVGYYYSN